MRCGTLRARVTPRHSASLRNPVTVAQGEFCRNLRHGNGRLVYPPPEPARRRGSASSSSDSPSESPFPPDSSIPRSLGPVRAPPVADSDASSDAAGRSDPPRPRPRSCGEAAVPGEDSGAGGEDSGAAAARTRERGSEAEAALRVLGSVALGDGHVDAAPTLLPAAPLPSASGGGCPSAGAGSGCDDADGGGTAGMGTEGLAAGEFWYEGEWAHDQRHGRGAMRGAGLRRRRGRAAPRAAPPALGSF